MEEQREARRVVSLLPDHYLCRPPLPEKGLSKYILSSDDLVGETLEIRQFLNKRKDQ